MIIIIIIIMIIICYDNYYCDIMIIIIANYNNYYDNWLLNFNEVYIFVGNCWAF